MPRIEHIQDKLTVKEHGLNERHRIITPEMGIPAAQQAEWMINLLQQVYTEHGIAKSPDKVVQSILTQECRCWFVLEDGVPVALSALIKQSDGSVELGRAVAITPGLGLGGIAMMRAGIDHLQHAQTPLVGEVRVSADFAGVPSGIATQKILFGQMEMKPHALAPMFGHGSPIRQEMFALSTNQDKQSTEDMVLPKNARAQQHLEPALTLSRNLFDHGVTQRQGKAQEKGFELVHEAPFSVIVPVTQGGKLEKVERAGLDLNAFVLLPIEMTAENSAAIVQSLEAGWIVCGVDRTVGQHSHPVLLMGKMRAGTVLAPAQLVPEVLDEASRQALLSVDKKFRQKE